MTATIRIGTAVDIWYGVTQDLEWYDPDAATTNNGVSGASKFDAFQNHGLELPIGNVAKLESRCASSKAEWKPAYLYLVEAILSVFGPASGQWEIWVGQGYAATTDGLWPYSYDDVCDAGITPNQSSPDGINYLPGMRLPACTCSGEDHPNARQIAVLHPKSMLSKPVWLHLTL